MENARAKNFYLWSKTFLARENFFLSTRFSGPHAKAIRPRSDPNVGCRQAKQILRVRLAYDVRFLMGSRSIATRFDDLPIERRCVVTVCKSLRCATAGSKLRDLYTFSQKRRPPSSERLQKFVVERAIRSLLIRS